MVPESVVHMVLRLRGDDSSSRTPKAKSPLFLQNMSRKDQKPSKNVSKIDPNVP